MKYNNSRQKNFTKGTTVRLPCNFFTTALSAAAELQLIELESGPMPNVMVALPNIGGALFSTPQSLADAHYLTAVQ